MASSLNLNVPLNRVEGDLEIRAEIADGCVCDAWASGTMYRGFEGILGGRGALDGLVITPRICGICTTSHLTAAARALDRIAGAAPPPDALRIRNVALTTEHIQSDVRHAFLTFAADLVNPAYRQIPLYEEAVRRYEPFRGRAVVEAMRETKRVLEILVIVGGQWPHSAFIVPGGIVSVPSAGDLITCRLLLSRFRQWYEERVLGCRLERWQEVRSAAELGTWLEERDAHREGELGFCLRFGRAIGLDQMGSGPGNFLSVGGLDTVPAGFARAGGGLGDFDERQIAEDVACSWAADYTGGKHPSEGETKPYATGTEGAKYSWAKAPRYGGLPAETGPLAETVVAGDPLFTDLVRRGGPNALVRELARLARPARLLPAMAAWLEEAGEDGVFYRSPGDIPDGEGFGLVEAARGALGHWVRISDGVIRHYQIITPTAWNASPRDSHGVRGPIEEALIGTPVRDVDNPVELGQVVRSFDPCLVCTVHAVRR